MAEEENKVDVNEEQAETESGENTENKAVAKDTLFDTASEEIEKNYSIDFSNEIRELSTDFARAYKTTERKFRIKDVTEQREIFSFVFEKSFPARINLINHLMIAEVKDPCFTNIIDANVARVRGNSLYTVIMERPLDRKIEDIFTGNPVPEKYLVKNILVPLAKAITKLSGYGFTHGRINSSNVFFNPVKEKIYLGECFSEPCGYGQSILYEAPERMFCDRPAKGDHNITSDFYALGVLMIFLITGKEPMQGASDEKIIDAKLNKGSYTAMTEGLVIPSIFQELLRGLVSDRSDKRWGVDQIDNWIKRKANPSASVPIKESMRGFIFNDVEYFSRRSLAWAMEKDHDSVKKNLKTGDLSRWIKHSILKPELAARFDALSFNTRLADPIVLDDDDISRIMILLDPEGPIMHDDIKLSIYGIGPLLAFAYSKNKRDLIQAIANFFNSGLVQFWLEATSVPEAEADPRYSYLSWNARKLIKVIRNPGLGFGMERALYETNPSLPCQSPLLNGHYVASLNSLLKVLDAMAEEKAGKLDPVDRHIAAFIAAKIDLRDEITLRRLSDFPNMERHPQIVMLGFLVAAQQSSKIKNIKGLCNWMSERLTIPLSTLNSKTLRDDTLKTLKKVSKDGSLQSIFNFITDPNYIKKDSSAFREARLQYSQLADRISHLSMQENTEKRAYDYGLKVAVTLGYVVLTSTLLYLIANM